MAAYKLVSQSTGILQGELNYSVSFILILFFFSYKSGVYKHIENTVLGGHAVALIGFGVEGGSNYWLAANSWGPNWGMSGYFKIAQGEGGIENQVYAGEAVY